MKEGKKLKRDIEKFKRYLNNWTSGCNRSGGSEPGCGCKEIELCKEVKRFYNKILFYCIKENLISSDKMQEESF